MKFLELNKKRHATKSFNDKEVDIKDIRTAIEIAQLAPSAHNMQPWKFVIVKERKDELSKHMYGANHDQGQSAQYVIALFTDTDMEKRARKVGRLGVNHMSEEEVGKFINVYPKQFATYSEQQISDYLALNAGIVAMNLVLALTDQGIASNILLGFNKSGINEVLDIDKRFRPELLITVGYSDEKPEASYRLPVDEIIEIR